jgi:murein DD-endopeptidase MepM/ murein hydrolase activator NlpD
MQRFLTKTLPWLKILGALPLTLIAHSALALELIEITPNGQNRPYLGDTISVILEVDDPSIAPMVNLEGKSYEAFPLGDGTYRAFIPTTPLDSARSLNLQISGDGETLNETVTLHKRNFTHQYITLSNSTNSLEATPLELARLAEFKALVTPTKYWDGPFLKPSQARVSTTFGVRRTYNGKFAQDYYHRGVDYAGGTGSPIVAPAAGRVTLVGKEKEGFVINGNIVGIDHGQGVVSAFLHMNRIDVKEGDFVQAGQQIGTIGSTGISTGPHLHWGLYVHGQAIDPVPWRFDGVR